jgi:hypothetical protein
LATKPSSLSRDARLFEAEQASKRELQESLQQQTATSRPMHFFVVESTTGAVAWTVGSCRYRLCRCLNPRHQVGFRITLFEACSAFNRYGLQARRVTK